MRRIAHLALAVALLGAACAVAASPVLAWSTGLELRPIFDRAVARRLTVPADEQAAYVGRMEAAFAQAGIELQRAQYTVLVDRNPRVQALLLFWRDEAAAWHLIGATLVSTGRRGGFEYFITPTGVFDHTIATPDFRAEGTRNELGVRGYGVRGMRVFDFGWVVAERTWGSGGTSLMRLQMHATDPDLLERRLGQPASKGCIRIPADLNRLIDRYGLLDADYEAALAGGATFWVLPPDRSPTPWSGRYLVVVDSGRSTVPAWRRPQSAAAGGAASAPARLSDSAVRTAC